MSKKLGLDVSLSPLETECRKGRKCRILCLLFPEQLLQRASGPHLWLLQSEDICHDGSHIVLHHAFVELAALADVLAGNDKGCLHFLQSDTAMPLASATMIGGDDENGVVGHTGSLHRCYDARDVAVEFLQFRGVL